MLRITAKKKLNHLNLFLEEWFAAIQFVFNRQLPCIPLRMILVIKECPLALQKHRKEPLSLEESADSAQDCC